jgi:hypothetical protein
MKTQSARPLYRRLVILTLLVLAWGTLSPSTGAMAEYTGCGEPYVKTTSYCLWRFCYTYQQGCADCDQGTACYSI